MYFIPLQSNVFHLDQQQQSQFSSDLYNDYLLEAADAAFRSTTEPSSASHYSTTTTGPLRVNNSNISYSRSQKSNSSSVSPLISPIVNNKPPTSPTAVGAVDTSGETSIM